MNITESKKLIGRTIYLQNGAFVTAYEIKRIIIDEATGTILPWAVDKKGYGSHLGRCNSDEEAVGLIRSKMAKPDQAKTQVTLVFA